MSVLAMKRFSIAGLKKDRKAILEELQALGITEVDTSMVPEEGLEKMNTLEAWQSFGKVTAMAENAIGILDKYAPEKTGLLSGIAGKPLVEREKFVKGEEERRKIREQANEIIRRNREISENNASISKLENRILSLTPWLALDIPTGYPGTNKTAVIIGSFPRQAGLDDIYGVIADSENDLGPIDVQLVSEDKNLTCFGVVCFKDHEQAVEEALRVKGFSRAPMLGKKTPAAEKADLEVEIEKLKAENDRLSEEIAGYSDCREDLKELSDNYRLRSDKYEVLGTLPQSKKAFFITGYVPEKAVPVLEREIGDKYDCLLETEELSADEDEPIALKNNKFSRNFEGILASYGLPHKGEVDPTTIMSFFYVFFFGMMLSDAGYGILVFLICFVLLKKFPRMSDSMSKALHLFMYCGISTIVWGVLFGGFFGDIVDIVSKTYFGHTVTLPALWFVPLNNPMKLLLFSLGFGTIHLFTGLALKGYGCLKSHDIMSFLCDVVFWYMFLIGLLMMLIPSALFASIAGAQITFPAWANMLAKILAIGGAVGLLLFAARDKKNFGLRIALGAYELYNVTGWLSDVLSYSRLLALGLATGVIASVVNQMGSMLGNSVFAAIAFAVIFVIGHTLNAAINILGAYVHTNRLQYVEFFGKFYEGGGRPFEPFKENTKYVDVKEVNS